MRCSHKRYFISYEKEGMVTGYFGREYGRASTLSIAKQVVSNCKRNIPEAYNIKIWDVDADPDGAICVFTVEERK